MIALLKQKIGRLKHKKCMFNMIVQTPIVIIIWCIVYVCLILDCSYDVSNSLIKMAIYY